jgi:PAS domain S-box-containing protein
MERTEEETLANDPAAYERLVRAIVDYAVYMLDSEGRIATWNPGAERAKGYSADEIIGQHFSRFYTEEDREAGLPQRALKEAAERGRFSAEGWRVRKDGSRFWAMVVIDPIFENGKLVGFAKVTRDLTEKRDAQLELEKSREQLFQSQKMEAVGQLTGGIAHDFNNLLTGISGSLEMLKTRLAQGRISELERYISAAQGAASRAATLTHRLLAFSRRQTLDPKPLDANKIVSGIEELARRALGPAVTLETIAAIGLWRCFCDPNNLENAILNLCINGRDAMPDGGRLTIETANAWIDEAAARERDMEAGQFVAICVTDTGMGMDVETAARAFDPFFTTKPAGKGTGLGLSMIYGFAKQSGGEVRIYSEVGVGTTVKLYLPRYNGPAEEAAGYTETETQTGSETVLVVDDEAVVRMLVTETLSELGYHPLEAGDTQSALKILQSNARIDVLITDVGLPGGMNGRQLADKARETRCDLKVLFITGYAENAAVGNGRLEPGMHVLSKPFAMDQLSAKIRSVLER